MLNDNEIVLSYGLFFVGLEDYAFFWEIVTSNFRKVIYIVAGDLLSSSNETVKVTISFVIEYLGCRRHCHHPFTNANIQKLQAIYRSQIQHY
jgi:hypothetical protein